VFGVSLVAVVLACHYGVHVGEKQSPLGSPFVVCCFVCFAVDLAEDDVTAVERFGICAVISKVRSRMA
jgi:hypothetical protein